MIEICYAKNDGVQISGKREDLNRLSEKIKSFLQEETKSFSIQPNIETNPFPYENLIKKVNFYKDFGKLNLSLENEDTLRISGSKLNLEVLADNFFFEEILWSGYHIHLEYFEGNDYINKESIPLIISLK